MCRKVARERNARTVLRFAPKQVIRATGLPKQYTDTYRDPHDATRHKSRRTLAYSFQQLHLPFHVRFGSLDLFSQDSRCDPTAEPHSKYLLGTPYVSLLCIFGESVFALIPDHEVRAAKLTNRWISGCWWGRAASFDKHLVETRNMVCSSADQFAENLLVNNGTDVKWSKLEGRNGIFTWKWTLEYRDYL